MEYKELKGSLKEYNQKEAKNELMDGINRDFKWYDYSLALACKYFDELLVSAKILKDESKVYSELKNMNFYIFSCVINGRKRIPRSQVGKYFELGRSILTLKSELMSKPDAWKWENIFEQYNNLRENSMECFTLRQIKEMNEEFYRDENKFMKINEVPFKYVSAMDSLYRYIKEHLIDNNDYDLELLTKKKEEYIEVASVFKKSPCEEYMMYLEKYLSCQRYYKENNHEEPKKGNKR